jgi:dephospho-CoA kinase
MPVHTLVVGVTGGIGSGKSTVADAFAALGAPVVDADAASHALTQAGGAAMPAIIKAFGPQIADANGALDRAAMRQRVFTDEQAKLTLEAILHPLIRASMNAQIAQHANRGVPYVLLVVPLLIESGSYAKRCQRVLVVDCDEAVQISRVMQRSKLTAPQVQAIMNQQATRTQRLAAADDVINNSQLSLPDLKQHITQLHEHYLTLAHTQSSASQP